MAEKKPGPLELLAQMLAAMSSHETAPKPVRPEADTQTIYIPSTGP